MKVYLIRYVLFQDVEEDISQRNDSPIAKDSIFRHLLPIHTLGRRNYTVDKYYELSIYVRPMARTGIRA